MRSFGHLGLALGLGTLLSLGGCQSSQQTGRVYRIAVIPKGMTHEFWQSIHRGAERAAADLTRRGIPTEIIWDGPLRERDALAQIQIVDRRVSTQVDGIVLAPQHSEMMVASVERAVEQGIPVVIIDSGLANPDLFVKYVATNNYNGGWLAAQYLLGLLEKEARKEKRQEVNMVLLRYQVGSESTDRREQGFEDYVESWIKQQQQKPDGLTLNWLSRDKYAGATIDSAQREAAPLLNNLRAKGLRIDGIFAPNESSANGMLNALVNSRKEGDRPIHLMGFDSSETLLQALARGDIDGLILQDPYKMGYLSVWTLVHHLEGYDVAGVNRTYWESQPASSGLVLYAPYRSGFFGMYQLAPVLRGCDANDPKVLGTGEHLITRENLRRRETEGLFDPRLQEERTILAPAYVLKRQPG